MIIQNGWLHLILMIVGLFAGIIFIGLTYTDEDVPVSFSLGRNDFSISLSGFCLLFSALLVTTAAAYIGVAASLPYLPSHFFCCVSNTKYWLDGIPSRRTYTLGVIRDAIMAVGSLALFIMTLIAYLIVRHFAIQFI